MSDAPAGPDDPDSATEFGWAGWLLVAAIIVAFLVIPAIIYVRPPGLPFLVSYLVLPLAPAFILALLAVWITT